MKDNLVVLHATIISIKSGNEEAYDIKIYNEEKCFDSPWSKECFNDLWDVGCQDYKLKHKEIKVKWLTTKLQKQTKKGYPYQM